jgi:quinol monooxygenase YgiN
MTQVALFVELKAKPGKEQEVSIFLTSAQSLAAQEPGTAAWFAVRFDANTFGIFDAFNDEAGREAHLSGPIAEALLARADELLSVPPAIRRADVLADTLPT